MLQFIFLICLLFHSSLSEQLISSPQYSELIFHATTTPVPGYIPVSYIVPAFNRSVDPLHTTYRSQFFVQPGEVDQLESDCLALWKNQYGVDCQVDGYKNMTTGTWYHADMIAAPIWRPYNPNVARLMFDSGNKHNAGNIVAVEGTWYFEFQTNGPFGGAKTGAQRASGMLGTCARIYFFDPDANRTDIRVRQAMSFNPSIRTTNEWGLPILFNDIRIFDDGKPTGRLTETIDYNKNATHYIINSRTEFLTYIDPLLL